MDDLPFDLSKKKKKKKKAVDFEELGETENVEADTEVEKPKPKEEEEAPATDFDGDFSNLKKKKKKKTFDMSDLDKDLPVKEEESEKAVAADEGDDLDLNFMTKKKKRKTKVQFIEGEQAPQQPGADKVEASALKEQSIWLDHEREATYEDLLLRVFDIMRERNPAMMTGEKKKLVMKPPQVSKAGAKKTAFANFSEICKMLHRQPKHLLLFLLSELGTSGSVDGSNSLIIKGRFQQKQIETVLRSYIKEYVTCHTCKSPETILQRDTRLYFLQCETCGSRCSVASIRSGFQAVTGKRAAMRAKTG